MKSTSIVSLFTLGLVLLTAPVSAVETLTLYDNFNNSYINPTKWTGSASDALETYKYVVFPVAGDGEVRLDARGYGFRSGGAAMDARSTNNRLRFLRLDPTVIRAIKATVKVNSAVVVGCPTAGSEVTQARVRLGGYFFNAGGGEPGRAIDDVYARIEIRRLSNDPVANQLNVRGGVWRCIDNDCVNTQTLFNQTLGTVLVGETHVLLIQWDPATNRFLFQLDAKPVVTYTYTISDTAPPQNFFDKKYIDLGHYIANCAAKQTQAFMSVNVDDVFLNTAATLVTSSETAQATLAPASESMVGPEPYIPELDE
jgi:hypothetical protein